MRTSLLVLLLLAGSARAQPPTPPRWQLTARPWQPLRVPRAAYLDRVEGAVRFWARHQDATGAIIDPFLGREFQYATPYFANALGVLLRAGRARDLAARGVAAMEQ